jgi:general secretion pathway protein K
VTRSVNQNQPLGARPDAGFILIAVLWLLAALATLASIYSAYAINSAVTARIPDDRLVAEAAIRAGVELTAYRELSVSKSKRQGHGAFETQVGRTKISVRFQSEAARIDLNAAPKELLAGLFVALGVGKSAADGYADRVIGWRDKAETNSDPSEAEAYKQAGLTYAPRAAPFNDALELSLVMGLPPAIVERMFSFVTVYSGKARVDVIEAAPEALAALPGVTPEALADVLQARASGSDGKTLIERLGPAGRTVTIEPNDATRASVLVEIPSGRRIQAEVVFRLTEDKSSPFDILYWRDDFDGPMRRADSGTDLRSRPPAEAAG